MITDFETPKNQTTAILANDDWNVIQSRSGNSLRYELKKSGFLGINPVQNSRSLDKPGALLRIKAPIQFGKTTLMAQVLRDAEQKGYRAIALNLRDAVAEDFHL